MFLPGTAASDHRGTPGQSDPQVKRMLRLESRLWSGYALPPPALQPLRIIVAGHPVPWKA
jgi:hypothetical protein